MNYPMAEVVIIGGGVVGLSIAYHLAKRGMTDVLVLEKESMVGTGSTGRCAGGFRHQFSTEINIRLSLMSIAKLQSFSQELDQTIDFHQDGYLFLLQKPDDVEAFRRNVALQTSLGIPVEFIEDPADNPEIALQHKRDVEVLHNCLAKLSPAHAEIIDLVYYHGKSVKEASQIVGVSDATVKTRMFYARKKLAELVQGRDRTTIH